MSKIDDNVKKELELLAKKPEDEIDFSDIPATTEQEWEGAKRGQFQARAERGDR